MKKINSIVSNKLFEWMRNIRRSIHSLPELGFQEKKTAEFISNTLTRIGVKHKTGVARTGIVGKIMIDKKAPTVALRADMDALPVAEETGLSFSSRIHNVMHACGHDGHIAMLLGATAILKNNPLEGNVVLIFQPAEESEGGAKPMIEEGVLDGVDMIFGGHIENHYNVGKIGIKKGVHTAYTDAFDITITGKGGHAAKPHETIDAVLIASRLVMDIQTIISRNVDPLQPAVISIGYINSGTVYNAIAEKAVLKGTIRTIDNSVRTTIINKIKKMVTSLSDYFAAKIDFEIKAGYPPVVNEEKSREIAINVAGQIVGKRNIISIQSPTLGGEDFAYYLQKIPGCFVRFGAAKKGKKNMPSHSPRFDFDEEVLRVGAAYLSELVRCSVNKLKKHA